MATIIQSDSLPDLDPDQLHWVYNSLDSAVTLEISHELDKLLDSQTKSTYNFTSAMQAPALEIMLRGVYVDQNEKSNFLGELKPKARKLQHLLNLYTEAIWGKPLNPLSPKQMQEFFYGWMNIPPVKIRGKITTNRAALEKISVYFYAKPVIKVILDLKDTLKMIQVLTSGVDSDGRMRCSMNVCGTDTGRWSSSMNAFGTGMNMQNPTDAARRIFWADPGMKMAYIDLEQAESRAVAYITEDLDYIQACESGDLHTTVCRMVWTELAWNGVLSHDKKDIAGQLFYRDFTYRDMAKRGGHGCLTPEHEVLTPSGWVHIADKPDVIMSYSGKALRWGRVSHWEDKQWAGSLVNLRGTSVSADLTDDHRIVFIRDITSQILTEEPAKAFTTKGFIPLGQNFASGSQEEPLAKLIAAYQCDGHQKSRNRVEFHFHKERKFKRLEMLAKKAGITYDRKGTKAYLHWNCPYGKAAGAYLLKWNFASLHNYYIEHSMWDGTVGKTNATSISSVHQEHLEWIQTVGRLIGCGGNMQKPNISGFGSLVFRLQQNNRKFATKASIKITREQYCGQVLCPTVLGGAFLIRHRGKISVTGNTNYYGKPWTMAKHLKVKTEIMESFQANYFQAYPGIPAWHQRTSQTLQLDGQITTALGRKRNFFGRLSDDSTLRKGIAYEPQSMVGDILNLGLWKLWKHSPELKIQILSQLHDAVLFQYPEELEDEIIPKALALMEFDVPVKGRILRIPCEAQTGWNWAHYNTDLSKGRLNESGIKDYTGHDNRTRPETEKTSILDRRVC